MLIQFSVENYRSIKERQTLSMVTSMDEKIDCVLSTGFNAAPKLLANTAIYGPNGSGKSNLISALEFFQEFIVDSHKMQPGDSLDWIVPFLFSKKTQKNPSTFEAVFIHENFLFQYGFTADYNKIHEEWLYATPAGKQKQKIQIWFERNPADIKKSVIRKQINGAKETWKEGTGENQLFLSVASNRQSEDFKKPFSWVQNCLKILSTPERLSYNYTAQQIRKNDKKAEVLKLMKGLDLSFDDVEVTEKTLTESNIEGLEKVPPSVRSEIIKDFVGKKRAEVFTMHKMEEGGFYPLPLKDESDGTRSLFAFSGPLINVLERGYTLIVDEIHNGLHPLALKGIISLFHNKEINNKNSQLIFTTHDTNTMNYLERDQIWLLDKGEFGNTVFTSLSEFKGRPDEAIEKRYLGGRYGALPNIKGMI